MHSDRTDSLSRDPGNPKENATAARQFRRRTEKTLKRLERFPASGTIVAEFPALPYREVYVKPYRFFYKVNNQVIWVVAVWHGARVPQEPKDTRRPLIEPRCRRTVR